jgi:predicted deacylase
MMFRARTIPGSLRAAAAKRGVPILTYEAGEPLRFDQEAIDVGVQGILRVLDVVGMRKLRPRERRKLRHSFEAESTHWIRAPRGGVLHLAVRLGQEVEKGDILGTISEPAGEPEDPVKSRYSGVVIGYTNNPLIHPGDAVVHLGTAKRTSADLLGCWRLTGATVLFAFPFKAAAISPEIRSLPDSPGYFFTVAVPSQVARTLPSGHCSAS